jgi:hypothetical protein
MYQAKSFWVLQEKKDVSEENDNTSQLVARVRRCR